MKTVLVTGATRGLGLSIAERLIRDGYRVLAAGRTLSPQLEALQNANDGFVEFAYLNLEDLPSISRFAKDAGSRFGPIYGLVNNAGVGLDGVLGTMHNSEIEKVMTINAVGPMILTKYVSRAMMLTRQGRIVNISSIIASTGFSGLAAYAASKAALEGFTRSLAREIGRVGITVNAVAPGFMKTDMTGGLQGDKLESILRRSPLGRLATTADAAGMVSFLLGPDASSITGTVTTVDGGSTA
ncbi:3-oxoacyl-ACP reductase [Rhizobium sullae]|uniref:3-oxoacyl-ACP reductase n=1 Tax=Rhizobium sullae TaxID=50338 RepID=A0A2N0D1A2_RHISU|nr:SDR family oxidoreductase [Rhizobium sullae]PKA39895.1 3-oxoacyl-ACP reductase [Rhizobium sullae]